MQTQCLFTKLLLMKRLCWKADSTVSEMTFKEGTVRFNHLLNIKDENRRERKREREKNYCPKVHSVKSQISTLIFITVAEDPFRWRTELVQWPGVGTGGGVVLERTCFWQEKCSVKQCTHRSVTMCGAESAIDLGVRGGIYCGFKMWQRRRFI